MATMSRIGETLQRKLLAKSFCLNGKTFRQKSFEYLTGKVFLMEIYGDVYCVQKYFDTSIFHLKFQLKVAPYHPQFTANNSFVVAIRSHVLFL